MAARSLTRAMLGVAMAVLLLLLAGCAKRHSPRPSASKPPGPTTAPESLRQAAAALREAGPAADLGEPAEVRTYPPEGMYEAIDGEADLFLSYDCQGLVVARYEVGDATIDAEVFDQDKPINAFGVYSQVRGHGRAAVEIGAAGVNVADEAILYWQSRCFVRVSGTSAERPSSDALIGLAQDIAVGLKGSSELPAWTAAMQLPGFHRTALQYVARNVLGHGFLTNAMIAEYSFRGSTWTLMLVRADNEARAREQWEQLKGFYRGRPDNQLGGAAFREYAFVGTDSMGRGIRCVRTWRYVVLIVGEQGTAPSTRLLSVALDRVNEVQD
ncbi:MAG: hypothetical protein JSV65_19965 [Armatimonadota bacterium]|nr:MAG: hypothetical protein JSV65_19965 [Armatimonadota bacterium]